jgi:hypothetical protein
MRPSFSAIICLILTTPTLAAGQAAASGEMRTAFESLRVSQWVRLAGSGLGIRQGRLVARSPTELILSPDPHSVRVPLAEIDTLWTRAHSTRTGAIVGALLGIGLGAMFASEAGERDTDRTALWAGSLPAGAVAGGLLGALFGTAVPRWKRQFP